MPCDKVTSAQNVSIHVSLGKMTKQGRGLKRQEEEGEGAKSWQPPSPIPLWVFRPAAWSCAGTEFTLRQGRLGAQDRLGLPAGGNSGSSKTSKLLLVCCRKLGLRPHKHSNLDVGWLRTWLSSGAYLPKDGVMDPTHEMHWNPNPVFKNFYWLGVAMWRNYSACLK